MASRRRAAAPSRSRKPTRGLSFAQVRALAQALPGVEEGTSYGTPAFKLKGKLLARLKEDGETLVIKVDFIARETLMDADPETFFITDHYLDYPMVLVRLANVRREVLQSLLKDAWIAHAQKRGAKSKG